MAFIDKIVKFHTFSKSTVRDNLTLGEAVNPSGHTVVSSQVRTDDIPAFIDTFQDTKEAALTWAATNVDANARHNDILYYGGKFNMGFSNPKCLIRVAKQVVDGKLVDLPAEQHSWQDFTIVGKSFLANADGKNVIAIHTDADICYVHGDNNAAVNSNQNSAFVRKADGSFLDHFVAPTDQILGGQPSLGYGLCLFKSGTTKALTEGEETGKNNYIGNTFAGLIHFMDTRSETADATDNYKAAGFSVNCFEYIGDKLDTTIGNIREEIQDIVGVTMEGVVASVGTNDAATSAGIGVDSSSKTSPKITFTAGSVATGETKLVSGGAVKTYVDTTALAADGSIAQKITSAISDATLADADNAIANSSSTTEDKLVTAAQVKEYVNENAKVTLTADILDSKTGIEISPNGQESTSFTIGIDHTVIATKESVDDLSGIVTALSETVGSNKTEVDGKISAIEGKLGATGEIGQAIADVKATADSAVQSVSKASGSSDLLTVTQSGTDVTVGLSDTVATKSDATTAATTAVNGLKETAITSQSVSGAGVSVTLSGKVGAPTLTGSVTPATYTSSTKTWTNDSNVAKASDIATAIADAVSAIVIPSVTTSTDAQTVGVTASGHEVSVATADYTKATYDETGKVTTQGSWTDTSKNYLVTGDVVRDFVGDETAKTLEAAKAYSNSLHTTSVTYYVTDTLPTVPSGKEEEYKGRIYLVLTGIDGVKAADGSRIEYMYVQENGVWGWEQIGTTTADLSGYAKSVTINDTTYAASADNKGVLDLGAFASSVTAGNGVASGTVSESGALSLTLTTASTTTAGISQLTDAYTKDEDSKAATGKSIAAAIETLDSSKSANGITVTQTDGVITSVTEELITAYVPTNTTSVEGNVAYVGSTKHVIAPEKFQTAAQMPATLTSWVADLSNLTVGDNMFANTSLTTFIGDLSSLTSGVDMFKNCTLDAESLEILAENLPSVSGGIIDIGASTNATDEVIATINGKGWKVLSNGEIK